MDIKVIEQTYKEVAKTLGWAVDKRVALVITTFYLTQGSGFRKKEHEEAAEVIKKKEGWTSPLKYYMFHIAAAFLALQGNPETGLEKLNVNQHKLNEAGFRKSSYTFLAAFLMQDENGASRAKELYDQMRQHHKFLTSGEDVPYAVLLGKREGTAEERAATMNAYYRELREHGFSIGNDLQWLSQIMTFNSSVYDPEVVGRVLAVRDFLQNEKIKIQPVQYQILGFLAITKASSAILQTIIDNTKKLENTKLFKWYKDAAFATAVQFEIADLIGNREAAAAAFSTSFEMIMQVQQAAMMASINTAIISSINNGSG
ncbi:DUF4003 family protein [Planococcus shenhongbingii]|uniref:DUF4003 family protein n=1 Tax=Planococcus shenhongbingii TaxID=3058398 RepID=A0ABT8NFL4_9BACL|nr:DUF4003 family protein [Planococcus sp. N017]MDN7246621.1 DUF4003 family protein [Planococcus sp. N017]